MAVTDRHGLSIACSVASTSPHETKLVEGTIRQRFARANPKRMIGDLSYNSGKLDQRLRQKHRVRLIASEQLAPLELLPFIQFAQKRTPDVQPAALLVPIQPPRACGRTRILLQQVLSATTP